MPLVLLLALAMVQLGSVVADTLRAQLAAREAARAAAVSAAPGGAGAGAARPALGSSGRIAVSSDGATVRATATIVNHTDVPLIGALLPDITIRVTATMAREPP